MTFSVHPPLDLEAEGAGSRGSELNDVQLFGVVGAQEI